MTKKRPKPRTPLESLRDAWRGFLYAFRTQRNFRIEVAAASIIVPTALFLPLSFGELAGLYFFVVLVLFAELINTAIECAVDRISPEHHPVAGIAKDIAATAVLLVGVAAVIYATVLALVVYNRI